MKKFNAKSVCDTANKYEARITLSFFYIYFYHFSKRTKELVNSDSKTNFLVP